MADIKVTSTELRTTAGNLSTGCEDINSLLGELKSKVDDLVSNDWTGAASESFESLYATWQTSGEQLTEALLQISGALEQSAQAYEDVESQISTGLQQ